MGEENNSAYVPSKILKFDFINFICTIFFFFLQILMFFFSVIYFE